MSRGWLERPDLVRTDGPSFAVRLTDRYDRMPSVNQVEMVVGHPLPALLLSAFEASAPIKIMLALERLAPER